MTGAAAVTSPTDTAWTQIRGVPSRTSKPAGATRPSFPPMLFRYFPVRRILNPYKGPSTTAERLRRMLYGMRYFKPLLPTVSCGVTTGAVPRKALPLFFDNR